MSLYGLLWAGNNHLAVQAGIQDNREDVLAYMKFVGGGETSPDHLAAYVDRAPETLKFLSEQGIPFRLVRGLSDHYLGIAPGGLKEGRSLEVGLISGFDLGEWRERVHIPISQPYFITAEEQINWGGINRISSWDQDLVFRRKTDDMRGKGVGLVCQLLNALLKRGVAILTGQKIDRLVTRSN